MNGYPRLKKCAFSETGFNSCYETTVRLLKREARQIQQNVDVGQQNKVSEEVEKHPTHNQIYSELNNRITKEKLLARTPALADDEVNAYLWQTPIGTGKDPLKW